MEVWMEIMRPGTWNEDDYSSDFLRELAASYDPEVREAPIVVGHPSPFEEEKPAYGWVKKLEIRKVTDAIDDDDISLWAFVDLGEEAEKMIRERQFPKRSVGISDRAPLPGIQYLNHVALLGASNPAVSRLTEVEMQQGFKDAEGILCLAEKDIALVWESDGAEFKYRVKPPDRFIDDSFRSKAFSGIAGIRAVVAKLKAKYVPDGNSPDSMVIQSLRFNKKNFDLAKARQWVNKHKGELSMSDLTLVTPKDEDVKELQARLQTLEAQQETKNEELAEANKRADEAQKELHERDLARLEADYEGKLQALVDNGNGAPAYIEMGVHKALVAMDAAEVMVDLKDGAKKASTIILDAFGAVPKFIEKKEVGSAVGKGTEVPATLTDNTFNQAMSSYGSDNVQGLALNEIAMKIQADEKIPFKQALLKASKIIAGGTK